MTPYLNLIYNDLRAFSNVKNPKIAHQCQPTLSRTMFLTNNMHKKRTKIVYCLKSNQSIRLVNRRLPNYCSGVPAPKKFYNIQNL